MVKLKYIKAHLDTAANYANLSHCTRLKVGAVIVSDRSEAIFVGYNGRPRGEPNIGEINGVTHPDVQHAEVNALKKIMRSTESSVDSKIFLTHSPCRACAIDLVDAGVKEVYFREKYRDIDGLRYMVNKGVEVYWLDPSTEIMYRVKNSGYKDNMDYIMWNNFH